MCAGYSFILALLDEISEYSTAESMVFLQDCFQLLFAIVLDGNASRLVGNTEALRWIFHMIEHRCLCLCALRVTCFLLLFTVSMLKFAFMLCSAFKVLNSTSSADGMELILIGE
jgi:hypothetical protein